MTNLVQATAAVGSSTGSTSQAGSTLPLPLKLAIPGAVLGATAYFLAFAGIDVWPLAFVCMVPLWISIHGQTPKRAFWLGATQGLVMSLGGFYWLQQMLMTFSGFPPALCALFTTILCAYQGGRMAVAGWLYARATRNGWPSALVFVAAIATTELVYPLLFPWYFAGTVHKLPALTQAAELGGPILVSVVVVLANVFLAEPLLARLERRKVHVGTMAAAAGIFAAALVFGAVRIPQVDGRALASPPLHVGIVQGNMGLMQKREDPAEGLRRHLRLTRELKERGAELVVWSESSATFPVPESSYAFMTKSYVSRHLGVPSILGGVIVRPAKDGDRERWFNVALATNAQGDVQGRYDKRFLLAFGEYLPFGETFPVLYDWSPNSGKFTPGTSDEPLVVPVGDRQIKATTLICYEDILPRFVNALVRHADPELLVNITNDAWFGNTTEPWEHLALAQFRAIEHRRYLVRSTNSGVSAIVDPVGRVIVHGGTFVAERLDGIVHLMRGTTVYEIVGDLPWGILAVLTGVAAFLPRRRRSAAPEA